MPTGYTYPIEDRDDFTFPEYLWKCARAFGALIEMRDDPMDAPIPDAFRPSSYHLDGINEAHEELAQLDRMTLTEVVHAIHRERDEVERENAEYRVKHEKTSAKYAAMRDQVEAWEPPTAEHDGLKRFMLEQIDTSTRFGGCYQRDLPLPTPTEWVAARRESLMKDLKYHEKDHAEEIARVAARNEWVRQLRGSVPVQAGPLPSEVVDAVAGAPDGSASWRDREALL